MSVGIHFKKVLIFEFLCEFYRKEMYWKAINLNMILNLSRDFDFMKKSTNCHQKWKPAEIKVFISENGDRMADDKNKVTYELIWM